jgi:hypothetical protein
MLTLELFDSRASRRITVRAVAWFIKAQQRSLCFSLFTLQTNSVILSDSDGALGTSPSHKLQFSVCSYILLDNHGTHPGHPDEVSGLALRGR